MIQTNAEYMSDVARVDRTVRRFMNMAVKEFREIRPNNIDFITDEIISKEKLSAERSQDMPYIEFACLINQVGGDPKYDWYNHSSLSEQQFYYKCIAGVLLDNKASIPVKLFMALPLKAFYAYLADIAAERGLYYQTEAEFKYMIRRCQYTEDYTIRDFLTEKIKVTDKPWYPWLERPAEYEKRIKAAHRDIGRLLIDSFCLAFSDRVHKTDICEKYRDPEVEIFDDDSEADWEDFFIDDLPFEEEETALGSDDNWEEWEQKDESEIENKENAKRKEGN